MQGVLQAVDKPYWTAAARLFPAKHCRPYWRANSVKPPTAAAAAQLSTVLPAFISKVGKALVDMSTKQPTYVPRDPAGLTPQRQHIRLVVGRVELRDTSSHREMWQDNYCVADHRMTTVRKAENPPGHVAE